MNKTARLRNLFVAFIGLLAIGLLERHIITCLFFMTLFYGICFCSLCSDGQYKRIKKLCSNLSFVDYLILTVIILGALVFVVAWIEQNEYIYYWDSSGYWMRSVNRVSYIFKHSFIDSVKDLRRSINNDSYNCFLPVVIALPLKIIGFTYTKYIFTICLFFFVPMVLLQGLIGIKILESSRLREHKVFLLIVFLAACFPGNYYAMLNGYIDIGFLIPASIAIFLFIDYDFRNISISRDVSIALMLVFVWISRRYAVYFNVGYVLALAIKATYVMIEDKSIKNIKKIVINFLIIGGVSIGILLILFKKFFISALLNNFSIEYSAYDAPISKKLASIPLSFGYISGLSIIISGAVCLYQKRNVINYLSLLFIGIVETLLFWRIQSMGVHHRMLLNLPIFVTGIMFLNIWVNEEDNYKINASVFTKQIVCIICLAASLLNFSKAFVPFASRSGTGKIYSYKYSAKRRGDIATLKKLADKLNTLTSGTKDHVYLLASGAILNSALLANLKLPYSTKAVNNLYRTHNVDLKDGFPSNFIKAKYIVTTDPIQLHLAKGQHVVSYLAKNINDKTSYIGCHYKQLCEFELDKHVKAKIHVKISNLTESDLQKIKDYYSNLYPGYESKFADRIKY